MEMIKAGDIQSPEAFAETLRRHGMDLPVEESMSELQKHFKLMKKRSGTGFASSRWKDMTAAVTDLRRSWCTGDTGGLQEAGQDSSGLSQPRWLKTGKAIRTR